MRDTPSGTPEPLDGKPYDSEAPTQLWQSPFKHLSEFPVRRAARRRERLEALLKGQEITSTGMVSATGLTHTAATQDVSPAPLPENVFPDHPPPPESIPTGTYTSIRPVSGPRMAVFIAVGVAAGGLAALQLNRVLTPSTPDRATAAAAAVAVTPAEPAPVRVAVVPAVPVPAAPEIPVPEAEACAPEEAKDAVVPPLQVEIVPVRPVARSSSKSATTTPLPPEPASGADAHEASSAFVNTSQSSDSSCSRYPSVHIPTQLHPRINPLMTSNQVFTEQGLAKTNRQVPNR